MTTDLTSHKGKLPRGLAKETVGGMKHGDDVIMNMGHEGAVRTAARYLGMWMSIGQIYRDGSTFYRGVILGKVKALTL
jgi:hypothetical protein